MSMHDHHRTESERTVTRARHLRVSEDGGKRSWRESLRTRRLRVKARKKAEVTRGEIEDKAWANRQSVIDERRRQSQLNREFAAWQRRHTLNGVDLDDQSVGERMKKGGSRLWTSLASIFVLFVTTVLVASLAATTASADESGLEGNSQAQVEAGNSEVIATGELSGDNAAETASGGDVFAMIGDAVGNFFGNLFDLTGLDDILPIDAGGGGTSSSNVTSGATRQADPSTMDTYQSVLDLSKNTRAAGQIWMDKSVFATGYDDKGDQGNQWSSEKGAENGTLTLDKATDGVDGTVISDADFLHVYSVLGSTQNKEEGITSPIDLVILLDMSGSMGSDVVNGDDTHGDGTKDDGERVTHSRIYKVLESINTAIDYVMKQNPTNRVAVVGYGATACPLLELGHYTTDTKVPDTSGFGSEEKGIYLKVGKFTGYGTGDLANKGSASYVVSAADKVKKDGSPYTRSARNDYSLHSGDPVGTVLVGYHTDLQAGLYVGFDQLYNGVKNPSDVIYEYDSKFTGEKKTLARIPVAFVMTDGGSNYALKETTETAPTGNEWFGVSTPTNIKAGHSGDYKKYRAETNKGEKLNNSELKADGGEAVILDTLLTASYMKAKVQNQYLSLLKKYNEDHKEQPSSQVTIPDETIFEVHTVSVDTPDTQWQVPRVYAGLDPADFFFTSNHDDFLAKNVKIDNTDISPSTWADQTEDVTNAFEAYETWKASDTGTNITFIDSDGSKTIKFNKLPSGEKEGVKNEDVYKNIVYNNSFRNIATASLTDVFTSLLDSITTENFVPLGGNNDLGVRDSVTYMDPIGKYMDVKDVKNLLLFGELYGITKTAVYSYQWNDQYMNAKAQGGQTFVEGWYYGEPTDAAADANYGPIKDTLPSDCSNANEAWKKGWVYRLNAQTASKYVPTLATIEDANKDVTDDVTKKQQNTEYTFYRLDMDEKDRQTLHMNPAYGKNSDITKTYDPDGAHLEQPGVYALSDLRIWVEDSGDYSDDVVEESGVESDSNFDEALWVNVPANMLPVRVATIKASQVDGNIAQFEYTTNQESGDSGYLSSFPLRVFYTVGIEDELLNTSRQINIASGIDAEYIKDNKVTSDLGADVRGISNGDLEFFSNWYNPLRRYSDYATNNTDYTYGDPVGSFSPNSDNRYYIFEKALPLYKAAYQWNGSNWVEFGKGGPDPSALSSFGGRLIAQDLNAEEVSGIPAALQEKGIEPEEGDFVLLNGQRLTDVTRPEDSANDPFSSESYFYFPIEYYERTSGAGNGASNAAKLAQYVICRKGSEFGSAYQSAHITNGDMLVWHDMNGKYPDYPYLSFTETQDSSRGKDLIGWKLDSNGYYIDCDKASHKVPNLSAGDSQWEDWANGSNQGALSAGDWTVCAKPGGLRVGALAQSVKAKGGDYKDYGGSEWAQYFEDRYGEDVKAQGLTWGYYENNITRTANNYSLPTISTDSNAESDDIIVNTYLGNNGRLYVSDTTVMMTKLITQDDSAMPIDTEREFNYQVFVNGLSGEWDAVVVRYNEATESWQRQFHYVDMELDGKYLLQNPDGTKAMVGRDGCRVLEKTDESGTYYYYPENCTSPYDSTEHTAGEKYNTESDGGPYYVYIGTNAGDSDINAPTSGFRVFHNNLVDGNGSVSTDEVTVKYFDVDGHEIDNNKADDYSAKRTFYANSVWLVSKTKYESLWESGDSPYNPDGRKPEEADTTNYYNEPLSNFELLTLDPAVASTSSSSEVTITSPYRTASGYWTKKLYFGTKGGVDNGDALGANDLYDDIIPTSDRTAFAGYTNDGIAQHTAEVTLKHGYGLILAGIPFNTNYRITEKLTEDDKDAGYDLKELVHNQQYGSSSVYRPGAQKITVWTKDGATYGEKYPSNYQDTVIPGGIVWKGYDDAVPSNEPFYHTNAVMWEYYGTMRGNSGNTKFDVSGNHHEVGDTRHTDDFYIDTTVQTDGTGNVKQTVAANPYCATCDEEQVDGTIRHYMYKDGKLVDGHYNGEWSLYLRDSNRYLVSPTVHFGVDGEQQADAETLPKETDSKTNYNGVYSVFGNTGVYEESGNFYNLQHTDKQETQINDRPITDTTNPTKPGVKVGDEITYELKWSNSTGQDAEVTITDTLDKGVDFVRASFLDETGAETLTLNAGGTEAILDGMKISYAPDPAEDIEKKNSGTVTWDLGEQTNGAKGTVRLVVKVNANAKEYWDYDGKAQEEPSDDFMVRNRATVRVADNVYHTNTVVNPVGEPDKTETNIKRADGQPDQQNVVVTGDDLTPGYDGKQHGPLVYVGDEITYAVSWRNYENVPAVITIRDPLDAHVSIVSASYDPKYTVIGENQVADHLNKIDSEVELGDNELKSQVDGVAKTKDIVDADGDEKTPETLPVIIYNANTVNGDLGYESKGEVTWNLGLQPAGASGKVTLVVKVLESATPVGYVDNTAFVKVNGDAEQRTSTIENPTPETEKTETTPGDGKRVKIGDTIDYQINWNSNETAHDEDEELKKVVITDPLDPGVDFAQASYSFTTKSGDTETVTLAADSKQGTVEAHSNAFIEAEEGPDTQEDKTGYYAVTIKYNQQTHTVTWTLYGDKAAVSEGHVDLSVKVTERALVSGDVKPGTEDLPGNPENDWDYREGTGIETEGGQLVQNRSAIQFGNDADILTDIVKNPVGPVKEEVTPGDGEQVRVGDEIHYRIYWQNYKDKDATVTIEDPLDPGVDFVEAEFTGTTIYGDKTSSGTTTLEASYDDKTGRPKNCSTSGMVTIPGPTEPVPKTENLPIISYVADGHTVTWNLGVQKAHADGYVDLYVKVNLNAAEYWQYGKADTPITFEDGGDGKDMEVVNRAGIKVGNDSKLYTDVMENPVPEKTETNIQGTPVDPKTNLKPSEDPNKPYTEVGPTVKVDDVITYEIGWKNAYDKPATVTISDTLNEGVDFFSAGFKDENLKKVELDADEFEAGKTSESDPVAGVSVSYNEQGQPVVTWVLLNRAAGTDGTVVLKVKVNEHALVKGYVDNQAYVQVGDNGEYTAVVENPTPHLEKTEITPGAGHQVMPGDQVDYAIAWKNHKDDPAVVTVRDALDPGVNFYKASFSGDDDQNGSNTVTLEWGGGAGTSGKDGSHPVAKPDADLTTDVKGNAQTVEIKGEKVPVTIKYDHKKHEITWTIGKNEEGPKVPAQYESRVNFSVYVNVDAKNLHTYDDKANFNKNEEGTDDQILNQGAFQLDNDDEFFTEIIPNPTTPQKEEVDVNDTKVEVKPSEDGKTNIGPNVSVGDVIRYTITWQNNATNEQGDYTDADVVITDNMSKGLEFVDAGYVVTDEHGIDTYPTGVQDSTCTIKPTKNEDGTTTITWTMPKRPARASGKVWVQARVTAAAEADGNKVVNNGSVQVGDSSEQVLKPVENPVSENGSLTITKVVTGKDADPNRKFAFTVTVDPKLNGKYGDLSFVDGVTSFTLANGQSKTVSGLPVNTHYTVTETDANTDGYVTTYEGEVTSADNAGGYIKAHDEDQVTVTNNHPGGGPSKHEETPGDGKKVGVGDQITYKIHWENTTGKEAHITIVDPLDVGATFVSASNGGTYVNEDLPGDITGPSTYQWRGYVWWDLGNQPAGSIGDVTLTVTVNTQALTKNIVRNQAFVGVDNAYTPTQIPENPLDNEPHKTETTPGEGEKVGIGREITYEIQWVNWTDHDSTVTITDPLDPGVDFVSASNGGSYDQASHTVTWNLGTKQAGQRGTVTLVVKVNEKAAVQRMVHNKATVTVDNQSKVTEDPQNPLGPDKEETTPGDGKTVAVGDEITYKITYMNDTAEAADVHVVDPLDVGVDYVGSNPSGTYTEGAQLPDKLEVDYDYHGVVEWTISQVAPYTSGTIELTVRVNYKAEIEDIVKDQAFVRAANNPWQPTPEPENPLEEPKKEEVTPGDGDRVVVGEEITYQINWKNLGDKKGTVTVRDPIDSGLTYVSSDPSGKWNKGTMPDGLRVDYTYDGYLEWTFENVEPGQGGTITLTVKVDEDALRTGVVKDQALIKYANDWIPTEEPENPLGPDKDEITPGDGKMVAVGDEITYKITYMNDTAETADVHVVDPLDVGVDYVGSNPPGTYTEGAQLPDNLKVDYDYHGVVEWTIPQVAPYTSGTIELTVRVNENAQTANIVKDQAFVKVGNGDWQATDEPENPLDEPKLDIEKTHALNSTRYEDSYKEHNHVKAGDVVTYFVKVTNPSQATVHNAFVKDVVPEGLTLVEGSISAGGVLGEDGRTITWALGDIEPSGERIVQFSVTIPEVTEFTTWRNVASTWADEVPDPEDSNEVHEHTDALCVTKYVNNSQNPDDPTEFTFTITVYDADGNPFTGEYPYQGLGGKEDGTVTFNANGQATFTLRNGQSVVFPSIPDGYHYEVIETSDYGYTVRYENEVGTVPAEVVVTNYWPPEKPWEPSDNPDNPDTPDQPDNPDTPSNPGTPGTPGGKLPKTGDYTPFGLYALMAAVAVAIIAAAFVLLRRKPQTAGAGTDVGRGMPIIRKGTSRGAATRMNATGADDAGSGHTAPSGTHFRDDSTDGSATGGAHFKR